MVHVRLHELDLTMDLLKLQAAILSQEILADQYLPQKMGKKLLSELFPILSVIQILAV